MKNYETMTKRELERELEKAGEFYLVHANLTKKDMIEVLRRNDEARNMTFEELVQKCKENGGTPTDENTEERTDAFTEVWNEAYNIYTDPNRTDAGRFNDMQIYLWEAVKQGLLSAADRCQMAADIMDTAAL